MGKGATGSYHDNRIPFSVTCIDTSEEQQHADQPGEMGSRNQNPAGNRGSGIPAADQLGVAWTGATPDRARRLLPAVPPLQNVDGASQPHRATGLICRGTRVLLSWGSLEVAGVDGFRSR